MLSKRGKKTPSECGTAKNAVQTQVVAYGYGKSAQTRHSMQMCNLPFPLGGKIHYTCLQHEGWADS